MKTQADGGSMPVPDPTTLTTQNLEREVDALKEALAAQKEIIFTRLNGMDKALVLIEEERNVFPNRIDEKISAMRGVHDERFRSIGIQFSERDTREERGSRDNKLAIDAALQAAKELVIAQNAASALAITKSEASTVKQMDQLGILVATANQATNDKIDDLKERLTRFESLGVGVKEAKESHITAGQYTTAIIGAIIAASAFIVSVIVIFLKK